ncbi:MAG: DUF1893 domain-containing protein [Clostridia bacterium]|nr:DUF1893 domain-containing protein [Clostridia bacterium]
MTDVKNAKQILISGEYTCVLCKDDIVHTSTLRGVKPLVQFVESGNNFTGFAAADKVVGKATAFLYVILGIKSIYASVVSKPALDVLKNSKIEVTYGSLAENIINRQGDGICPFEEAVLKLDDHVEAYKVIRHKMKEMNI